MPRAAAACAVAAAALVCQPCVAADPTKHTRHGQRRCHGDEPYDWTNATECRRSAAPCASGDLELALRDTAVARCGPAGDSVRYFNRSMTMDCLDRLARSRDAENARSSGENASYRILLVGVSNMRHVWHSMASDDVYTERLWEHRSCSGPEAHEHANFHPHKINYIAWQGPRARLL